VIALRWGSRLRALFDQPGGRHLRDRLESMANAEYHALLRQPAGAVRTALVKPSAGEASQALDALLAGVPDAELSSLVAHLGGHALVAALAALDESRRHRGQPCVIIADTIKGWGLPFAGDPMNHGALLGQGQLEELRAALGVAPADEWARFPDGSPEAALIAR